MKQKIKKIFKFILFILSIILLVICMNQLFLQCHYVVEPDHTIQDIHHWCCKNDNRIFAPTGEKCDYVINEVYGGC